MKQTTLFAAIAAVAAGATIPLTASAATQIVTNTVDGIKWQLLIDTSAKTASVGPNTSSSTAGYWSNTGVDWDHERSISQSITGTADCRQYDMERHECRRWYAHARLLRRSGLCRRLVCLKSIR